MVDKDSRLTGTITRHHLKEFLDSGDRVGQDSNATPPLVARNPVVAYPDEPLRAVVHRMAETGKTRLPVLNPADSRKLLRMISPNDLLHAPCELWTKNGSDSESCASDFPAPRSS